MHTYTMHLTISAANDVDAYTLTKQVTEILEADPFLLPRGQGFAVLQSFVTDADDWAEHVDGHGEGICTTCLNERAVDRLRIGDGGRKCRACADASPLGEYPIEDEEI